MPEIGVHIPVSEFHAEVDLENGERAGLPPSR
jgi:hypothetical protein